MPKSVGIYSFPMKLHAPVTGGPSKTLKDHLADVNKHLHQIIRYADMKRVMRPCPHCVLPDHMCVYKPLLSPPARVSLFAHLEKMWSRWKSGVDVPIARQAGGRRTFVFDRMSMRDVVSHLAKQATSSVHAERVLHALQTLIASVKEGLGVTPGHVSEFMRASKCVIIRYSNKGGLHMHIDKVWRADGPVFTMHIGPHHGMYILTKINDPRGHSLAITLDEGDITVLDGTARFDWAHGLPDGYPDEPTHVRYSFVVLASKITPALCTEPTSPIWKVPISYSSCHVCAPPLAGPMGRHHRPGR